MLLFGALEGVGGRKRLMGYAAALKAVNAFVKDQDFTANVVIEVIDCLSFFLIAPRRENKLRGGL